MRSSGGTFGLAYRERSEQPLAPPPAHLCRLCLALGRLRLRLPLPLRPQLPLLQLPPLAQGLRRAGGCGRCFLSLGGGVPSATPLRGRPATDTLTSDLCRCLALMS